MFISDILAKYDTDKVNPHTYGPAYDSLFAEFDQEAKLNIMEIGVQKGGSLCAWQDYFPNATVSGLDIVDVVLPEYRRHGINYILCDINDYKTDTMFDIVVDDGSHWLKDVVRAVDVFSRKLNVDGIMVIEDVQFPNKLIPTVQEVLRVNLDYNKGFKWELSYSDGWKKGLEDDNLLVLKRIK